MHGTNGYWLDRLPKYLPSNNNDAPKITKYGFLVWPDAPIVALCMHCTRGAACKTIMIEQLHHLMCQQHMCGKMGIANRCLTAPK